MEQEIKAMSEICGTKWRHKKRGSVVEVLHDGAHLQCAGTPDLETKFSDEGFVVYHHCEDRSVWIRPRTEFLDGRFEKIWPKS